MFKLRAVLTHCQPFLLKRQREKKGDQSRFKCRKWSIIMQFAVVRMSMCCVFATVVLLLLFFCVATQ
jgi:hypothetical protein